MERAPSLFESLAEVSRDQVPVVYRSMAATPLSGLPELRVAESRPYRAKGYLCGAFYRPVSKCLPPG
ncbi:MAG TPA: hypothetical protein VHN15_12385 [Thermoanaerobaculia bacterium]|nr:hypothetical protein [Thermoanaerobaculia bacterium]